MDPKKLEAFGQAKGGGGGPPPGKKEGGKGGQPPPGDKGNKPPKDDKDGKGKEGDQGEDGGGKYGQLKGVLKEFSDDVEASIDELDHGDLSDPEKDMAPEDEQILKEGLGTLDKKLVSALREAGQDGMSVEDAQDLASQMEGDESFEDAGLLAGWLYRATQAAKDMPEGGDSSGKLPDSGDSSGKLPEDEEDD